jgi:hypothetical protein
VVILIAIPLYPSDLQISRVASHEVMGTYTFDIFGHLQLGDAVKHARAQLMKDVSKQGGYNFLLLEGCVLIIT